MRALVCVYYMENARAKGSITAEWVCGCVRVCCARFKRAELRFSRRSRDTHTHTNEHVDTAAASLHRPYATNTAETFPSAVGWNKCGD